MSWIGTRSFWCWVLSVNATSTLIGVCSGSTATVVFNGLLFCSSLFFFSEAKS